MASSLNALRFWRLIAATVLVCVSFYVPAFAQVGSPQPRIVVVAVDHLRWDTFRRSRLPNLNKLRLSGAVGLVSPGLARYPDPAANEWATFTAGDVINVRNGHIGLLERQLLANGLYDQVEIVRFGDCSAAGRLRALDSEIADILRLSPNRLILCSVTPLQTADGSWADLGPIVVYPGSGSGGRSVVSTTTRTPGLVALRDIAPTILALAGAPVPQSMSGAPLILRKLGRSSVSRDSDLSRMVTITRLGQQVIVPLCWFLGLSALFAVAGGAWIASGRKAINKSIVCYLLRLVIAAPLAMLMAPIFPVSSVYEYLILLVVFDLLIAFIGSPVLLISATTIVLIVDGLTGSHLIAATVISGYWLSGIRFYGIGNEFMGVLIGMALLSPVMILSNQSIRLSKGPKSMITAVCYLAVVFVLSYPGFGAKAGGAVTSIVTFGLAWTAIYVGKRPTWVSYLISSACGFVAIFAFASFASRLHAPPSHIQSAVTALHAGRLGYIKHVAVRKAKMAVKTIATPGGAAAIFGIVPLFLFWRRSALSSRVDEFLLSRPELAGALHAGVWGLLASLMYNDSGGVAFLFFFGAMALVLLHEMVRSECVSSRLTLAMSG